MTQTAPSRKRKTSRFFAVLRVSRSPPRPSHIRMCKRPMPGEVVEESSARFLGIMFVNNSVLDMGSSLRVPFWFPKMLGVVICNQKGPIVLRTTRISPLRISTMYPQCIPHISSYLPKPSTLKPHMFGCISQRRRLGLIRCLAKPLTILISQALNP